MIKGSKRQIIFLQDLKKTGKGIFECAYFILNGECVGDFTESAMLLEAERIVDEAQKFSRRYDRVISGTREKRCPIIKAVEPIVPGNAMINSNAENHRKRRSVFCFLFGVLAGAALFCLICFIWRGLTA